LSKINSRFTPPVGVGGLSAENQKNDAALDEIARQEIYAKFGLSQCGNFTERQLLRVKHAFSTVSTTDISRILRSLC
jgi:hypothetical protein